MSGPASAVIDAAPVTDSRPWPRALLAPEAWAAMARHLADEPDLVLIALWAETASVHALLLDTAAGLPRPVSTPVVDGAYPALSPSRPEAAWFERSLRDLCGHQAAGGRDPRPWLDHGRWPAAHPLSLRPGPAGGAPEPPELVPPESEALHQLPLGPVQPGLGEPGHLRLTLEGERIVRAEARLGYAHKGVLTLMRGKSPRAAARYAARLAGDATVAHAIAFARATEAALGTEPPQRAAALRAVMAETERMAVHLGVLGRLAAVAGQPRLAARLGLLRERLLRAAALAFGHRLMMDCVVPGGVAADIAPGGPEALATALAEIDAALPSLRGAAGPSGVLALRLCGLGQAPGATGPAARAAGLARDVRLAPGYSPYAALGLGVTLAEGADAAARASLRVGEIAEARRLIAALLAGLPEGGSLVPLPSDSGEGIGFAESPRGDVWHWLRLDNGLIAAAFPRDPSWALWPLLESALAGAGVSDLPAIAASFDPAISPMDL